MENEKEFNNLTNNKQGNSANETIKKLKNDLEFTKDMTEFSRESFNDTKGLTPDELIEGGYGEKGGNFLNMLIYSIEHYNYSVKLKSLEPNGN